MPNWLVCCCWQYHFFFQYRLYEVWMIFWRLFIFRLLATEIKFEVAWHPALTSTTPVFYTIHLKGLHFFMTAFSQLFSSSSLLFFYPKFREAFFTFFSRSQFEKFDSLILGYQISCSLFFYFGKNFSSKKLCVLSQKRTVIHSF